MRSLATWLLLGTMVAAAAPAGTGKVTAVLDGDTIEFEDSARPGQSVRVRLYGVDCPELGQAAGAEARDYTSRLCLWQTVTLQTRQTDKSGVVTGEVALASGAGLSRRLVERGLAWLTPGVEVDPNMADLEQQALAAKRGLWRDPKPTPPWEYRKQHPTQAAVASPAPAPPPAAKATAANEPATIKVSRSAVEDAWESNGIGMIIAAGARPYTDADGNMIGALVPTASAVPLAGQLGLRDGDVVLSVNGVRLKSLNLMSVAEELEDKPVYVAEILRGGRTITVKYVVGK